MTPIERLEVPATVQAVLAARIDRLPEREKRLLQVASVIGKDFPEPLLAAVAELPAEELKAALAALRRAEFIHEQAIYPVVEYAFKHPLTQEVALGSQLKERRRQVHAAVARAIEQQHPDHLDERAAAAGAPLGGGRRGAQRGALAPARGRVGGAHRLCRRDPPLGAGARAPARAAGRSRGRGARHRCLQQLLSMGWRVGMGLEEARALLDEGQALANAIGDRRSSLYLSMVYGRALCGAGEVAAYLELAIENRRAALELDDIALQAGAWALLTDAFCFAARFPEALQSAEEGLARFPRSISPDGWVIGINPYTVMSFWRGFSLSWMGRLPEAVEELARCRRLCEEDGTPEMTGYALVLRCRSPLSRPRRGAGTRERPPARGDQPHTRRTAGIGRLRRSSPLPWHTSRLGGSRTPSRRRVARSTSWAGGEVPGGHVRGAPRRGPAAGR